MYYHTQTLKQGIPLKNRPGPGGAGLYKTTLSGKTLSKYPAKPRTEYLFCQDKPPRNNQKWSEFCQSCPKSHFSKIANRLSQHFFRPGRGPGVTFSHGDGVIFLQIFHFFWSRPDPSIFAIFSIFPIFRTRPDPTPIRPDPTHTRPDPARPGQTLPYPTLPPRPGTDEGLGSATTDLVSAG